MFLSESSQALLYPLSLCGRSCLNHRDELCQVHCQRKVEHSETRATSRFQTKANPDLSEQAHYKARAHLSHHQIKQNPNSTHEIDPVSPHQNEADTDPSCRMTLHLLTKEDVSSQQLKAPHHTNIHQHQTRRTATTPNFPHIEVTPAFETEMDPDSEIKNKPYSPCCQLQVSSPVDVDSLPTPPPTDWWVK